MKATLTLLQVTLLDQEINGVNTPQIKYPGLLHQKIAFHLKFRFETILVPQIEKAMKLISNKKKEIALNNGAIQIKDGVEFKLKDGATSENDLENPDGYNEYKRLVNEFLEDEKHSIEMDANFKLSAFKNEDDKMLYLAGHYKIICKFIQDDLS